MKETLSESAEIAAKFINTTDRNIFITGKAGTGKTTFLKYIVEHTYKNTVVTAPTGIAAINASGITLHSLLHLPFGVFIPEKFQFGKNELNSRLNTPQTVLANSKFNISKRKLLRELELLIIDEVSMLRADLLDCIDVVLRHIRRRQFDPFGGVQLLLIGDLWQLPPVAKDEDWQYLSKHYTSTYFFESRALKERPLVYIELKKLYRQSDQEFIDILNRLRNNEQTEKDFQKLNSFYKKDFSPASNAGYIHITTHNRKADIINEDELNKISELSSHFKAEMTGDFAENLYPNQESLEFKKGAQVMFIKNDLNEEKRYFNGKIGKITSISSDSLIVKCDDEKIEVKPHLWENKRYTLNRETNEIEEKVIGSFKQFPIKLAWAITVHKSQGLTFEKAILDLSGAFAPGQVYVALSRLTSLKGLVLSSAIPNSGLEIAEAITLFSKNKSDGDKLKESLKKDRKGFLLNYAQGAFDFSSLLRELGYHEMSFNKEENRSIKQQYHDWTKDLINEAYLLKKVGDKFILEVNETIAKDDNYLASLNNRVRKAKDYFSPLIEILSTKIKLHLNELGAKGKVKNYRKELVELESLFYKQNQHMLKVHLLLSEAVNNRVLTKNQLKDSTLYKSRKPAGKKEKIPTREITYQLYKEKQGVEEIANKRNLVAGTIEGHLSHYVALGDIEVTKFLSAEKLDKILKVYDKIGSQHGALKISLGEKYSYGDIKFALAHRSYLQSLEAKKD